MTINNLTSKIGALHSVVKSFKSTLIAFSGGVDSTFLLKAAHDALTPGGGRVLAVTARSSTYPERELKEAIELARQIGAEHMIIDSEELDIEGYSDNPPNRCYYCKGELFAKLVKLAEKQGINIVFDGANADDMTDWRPGSKAAAELGVRSPLKETGFTKQDIRDASKQLGLPTWNKPAFACLASRVPYGEKITQDKLTAVDRAEQALRDMGFGQLRVRHHGEVCRIELEPKDIPRSVEPEMAAMIHKKMRAAGFRYVTVDLLGYRTGSMNEGLGLSRKNTKPD